MNYERVVVSVCVGVRACAQKWEETLLFMTDCHLGGLLSYQWMYQQLRDKNTHHTRPLIPIRTIHTRVHSWWHRYRDIFRMCVGLVLSQHTDFLLGFHTLKYVKANSTESAQFRASCVSKAHKCSFKLSLRSVVPWTAALLAARRICWPRSDYKMYDFSDHIYSLLVLLSRRWMAAI